MKACKQSRTIQLCPYPERGNVDYRLRVMLIHLPHSHNGLHWIDQGNDLEGVQDLKEIPKWNAIIKE